MKKLILLSLVSIATITYAHDQELSPVESNVQWIIDQTFTNSVVANLKKIMASQPDLAMQMATDPRAKQLAERFLDQTVQLFRMHFKDFTTIYLDHFTEEEIQEIVNYYKSSLGKKMLDSMGPMMLRVSELMQPKIALLSTQFESELAKLDITIEESYNEYE
ncbi:DUF2059 domain-containing protein [bacterium]|jgi:hypothetical protein|nr:DUF2059 domain-containing protein [bacterium]MBT5014987.1 DUF2059 domain-containing protein [bacterium]